MKNPERSRVLVVSPGSRPGQLVNSNWLRFAARAFRWRTVLPVVAVLVGVYLAVHHPWLISWGATAEEQGMALPGDDAPPATCVTRAITIGARPSAVWPWIVQMGQDRAGF
jgi:hypothetical protein